MKLIFHKKELQKNDFSSRIDVDIYFEKRYINYITNCRKHGFMNNGNFNGYDPNRNGQNGYNDPYQANGYQQNYQQSYPQQGYQQSYPQQGYQPYQGDLAQQGVPFTGTRTGTMSLSDYSKKIFLWMGAGLAVTFFVALGLMLWLTSGDPLTVYARFSSYLPLFYGGIVVELVLAIVLNIFVAKMPYGVSLAMFFVYSLVSGVTFTPILVVYDAGSAIFCFAAAAVLFIGFAIYGTVTKRDLTKLGPILMIGVLVLLLFSVVGLIFNFGGLSILIGVIGVAIFVGLTAYDVQKIKKSYESLAGDDAMLKKLSVNLALQLYLDFINIFIYLLRLFGKRN